MKTFRNLINGKYVTSLSGETFPDFNPANTDDILGHFQSSGREDADNACLAASKAFERWKDYPWVKKSRILRNTMNILERRRDELVYVLTKEQGRPLKESLAEVDRTIDVIDFYTGEVRRNQGWVMPSAGCAGLEDHTGHNLWQYGSL